MQRSDYSADYYALLGVDPSSSPETITQAYHRLAREYHPDLNPQDSEAGKRFKEINEAYQTLSDPDQRAQYDQLRASGVQLSGVTASSAESTQDEQPVTYQKSVVVHSEDIEGVLGDFSTLLHGVASQAADELRESLRDFATELDTIVRTGGNRAARRQGFPPPPPNGRPPGRAPKP